MQRKDINSYVRLGALMQFLLHSIVGMKLAREWSIIRGCQDLLRLLGEAELPVSGRAAWRLKELVKEFEGRADNAELQLADKQSLEEIMLSLPETVQAELAGVEFLATTPKRLD